MTLGQSQMEQNHEVVISGMAGVFPECDDVDELWSRLLNKDDGMVSIDNRRWIPGEMGVPAGVGKIREPNHFDMSFFGVSRRLCINMDPLTKLCLEQSFRAVCDAGVNPQDLSGALTAVLMASVTSETEYDCVMRGQCMGHAMLGHSRTMQANRISYFMNLKGPSLMMDSSWCGGLQGLQYGHDLISGGHATSALVGVASLVYRPEVSIHYQSMGRLSEDSKTRCFSDDASGYARSEGCVVFFLQRKEHARRSYGSILSALALSVGSRDITFPEFSGEHYRKLLRDSYKKAKASPKDLGYIEAYSAGSKEIETRELNAVADVLLKERSKPLPVGCIKSNLGHCEGASSLVGAIKIAMILDRGVIPPNINYTSPNPNIPALVSGDLQVVTEVEPLEGDLVATTEIGAAGNMGHLVMKRHDKSKGRKPVVGELPQDGLPRLVLMSDRSEANMKKNNDRLMGMAVDEEFVCLMNHVYRNGVKGHLYRGFTVLNGEENKFKQIEKYEDNETKRPIWFMFSGMGSQWPKMGRALMKLPVFAAAVQKCHDVLAPKGVNVLDILNKDDPSMFDTILHSFVGIAAVQIGLVDILKALGIEPDGIVGHSVGELGCAYADGCFTAEQMILSAYARGRASVEAELIRGMMAAVGKGYHQIKDEIPDSIEVACHNSDTSCTLSGPAEDMETYIGELKERGIFAKLVNVANIAYHSRYIKPAAPALLKYLKEVIPEPKLRSSRWISSSIPESQWESDLAQKSSAEYHTNNLLGSVLFEEASEHIPSDAIVIEIAPHGLLQAIVKRSLKDAVHIPLTSKFEEDGLMYLLGAIGKMYIHGIPVDVQKLYPPIEFPVSRETPAISPFVGWQHSEEFVVEVFDETSCRKVPCWKELRIVLTEERYASLGHHKIRERIVLPPSFYIGSIIDIYSDYDHGTSDSCVAIENFDCQQEVEVPKSTVDLFAQVHRGTGHFSFNHNGKLIAKGKIVRLDKSPLTPIGDVEISDDYTDGKEMLQFINTMGLNISAKFAAIEKFYFKDDIVRAVITWNGSVIEFLKNCFTLVEFYESKKHNELRIVSRSVRILLDLPTLDVSRSVWVEYNATTKFLSGNGIQVLIPETVYPPLASAPTKSVDFSVESFEFVPSVNPDLPNIDQTMSICSQLVIENIHQSPEKSCVVRVVGIGPSPFLQSLNHVSQTMRTAHSFHITSVSGEEEFYLRDMSFIHQEIIWIVSSQVPSHKLRNLLSSALRGFMLAPKHSDNEGTIKSMIEFTQEGNPYILGSSVKTHREINYTTVEAGANCIDILRNKLQKAADDNWKHDCERNLVILAGKLESITSTIALIEEAENLPHSYLLRYLATDKDLPKSILDNNEVKMQVSKHLKQNIFKNGVWGSLRRLPVPVKQKSLSNNVSGEKFIYSLASLSLINDDMKALGLNLSDVTGTVTNDTLGVFDIVTSNLMGLATYDPKLKTFTPDQILKWPKPESWSYAEAATVPLLYSLAASIIYFKENPYQVATNNVLITNGILPISQAMITLALHEKMDVFTTVENEKEKANLLAMFPLLKPNHILDHGNNDFYIHIKRLTNGKGTDKIIFTLDGEDKIAAATKCLPSQYGTVVLLSKAPMETNSTIGMLMFLEEGAAMGVTAETMMSISYQEKKALKDKVLELIKIGVIKPFRKFNQLPRTVLNIGAVAALQQSPIKVIYQSEGNKGQNLTFEKYICDKKKNYVIVCVEQQLDLWIDLAEWLLKRDARKLTIFLTQMALSSVNTLRYQSLTKQYHGAKLNLHSIKHLANKESMIRCFNDIGAKDGIDTIFLIGTALNEKTKVIDEVFRIQQSNCALVCLGEGGDIVTQKRHDGGLRSLCVRCKSSALRSPDILRYLEQLLLDSYQRPVVLLTEQVQRGGLKGAGAKDGFFIPETLPELRELLRLSETQARFREVPTNTARLPFIKEIWSVFVIPGLRPGQTYPLCNQLFNPALEARLPEENNDLDQLASQLVNQMTSSRITCFTLVADGWGGILALHMAAKLEAQGKYAKVILLNTTPQSIVKMASDLLKDETALIDRYLKLSSKAESDVRSKSSWEEKLKTAIHGSNLDEVEGSIVARAITLLKNRLHSILNATLPKQKIRTKAHVFKYGSDFQESGQTGLSEYATKDHILHLIGGETIEESMTLAAKDVNTLVLFEYKDAANPPIEDRLGVNILKTTCFDT